MEIKSALARIFKVGGYPSISSNTSGNHTYNIIEMIGNSEIWVVINIKYRAQILEIGYYSNESFKTLVIFY